MRAEYFASRLFDRRFVRRIEAASAPVIPPDLEVERGELVEQALLRAYDHRGLYHGESEEDLQRWVLRLVSNVAREVSRERGRRSGRRRASRN